MAELKTKRNKGDVEAFLNSVPDEKKRRDSFTILELMKQVTGEEPKMWGDSIVGFGSYHYKYESGARRRLVRNRVFPRVNRTLPFTSCPVLMNMTI
jgi:hypothetical protein